MWCLNIYTDTFVLFSRLEEEKGRERSFVECEQGRIEPPKAARGHATFVDGKMLSVNKYT